MFNFICGALYLQRLGINRGIEKYLEGITVKENETSYSISYAVALYLQRPGVNQGIEECPEEEIHLPDQSSYQR